MPIKITACYCISPELITREIEGELVIVPMISGVGNIDSEMYTLNKTGIAIWKKLDGTTPLDNIIKDLSAEFNAPYDRIKDDVMELMENFKEIGLIFEK